MTADRFKIFYRKNFVVALQYRIVKMSVVYDYEHEKQKYLIMVEFRKTQIDLL